jgi:hypothetical protein
VDRHSITYDTGFPVIAALSKSAIESSIRDLQDQDRLTIALKTAIRNGADINSLSEASGLTPAEIVRRIDSELIVLSDLELIAGLV